MFEKWDATWECPHYLLDFQQRFMAMTGLFFKMAAMIILFWLYRFNKYILCWIVA